MRRGSRRVLWSPEADEDVIQIWAYLARNASENIADRQVEKIHARAAMLGRLPFTGRKRDELVSELRSVLVRPYVVFYRATDTDIGIVRVLHGSRDLEFVLSSADPK